MNMAIKWKKVAENRFLVMLDIGHIVARSAIFISVTF